MKEEKNTLLQHERCKKIATHRNQGEKTRGILRVLFEAKKGRVPVHVPQVLQQTTLRVSFGREQLVHSGVQGEDGHPAEHRPGQFFRQDGLLCASFSLRPAPRYRKEPDLGFPPSGVARRSVVVEDYAP